MFHEGVLLALLIKAAVFIDETNYGRPYGIFIHL